MMVNITVFRRYCTYVRASVHPIDVKNIRNLCIHKYSPNWNHHIVDDYSD